MTGTELVATALAEARECKAAATISPADCDVVYRRMSDIEARPIHWLWKGRFARGKVSILAGHPGLGKSQVALAMAAIVTTGGRWPVDGTSCEKGNVVLLSAEDDAADTIKPRLAAAGADTSRVIILDAVREWSDEGKERRRALSLEKDLPPLDEMLNKVGNVALVIVDPLTAYLGNTDSHKNAEVRALLAPLGDLAARHGVAIVCVSHLNKGGGSEALTRVTGSLAFVAAARAAFIVTRDQENAERRLFLPIKNNIGNDQTGLAFRIEGHPLTSDIETSRVAWEASPVSITADEAMTYEEPEERSALDAAKTFLSDLLADGPAASKTVFAEGREAGCSENTVRRAKNALGIIVKKTGMTGGWEWSLPPKMPKQAEDAHTKTLGTFGDLEHLRPPLEPEPGSAEGGREVEI